MTFSRDPLAMRMIHDNLSSTYHCIEFVGNSLNSENQEIKGDAERIFRNLQNIESNMERDEVLNRIQKLTGSSVDPRHYVGLLKQAYDSGEDMEDILSDAKKAFDYIKIFFG